MNYSIIGQWGYKPLVGDPPVGSYQVVYFLPSMIKQDLWIFLFFIDFIFQL